MSTGFSEHTNELITSFVGGKQLDRDSKAALSEIIAHVFWHLVTVLTMTKFCVL